MSHFLLYNINDEKGNLDVTQRKRLMTMESVTNSFEDAYMKFRPVMFRFMDDLEFVRERVIVGDNLRYFCEVPYLVAEGTHTYEVYIHIVKEREGIIYTARFQIVESLSFLTNDGDYKPYENRRNLK